MDKIDRDYISIMAADTYTRIVARIIKGDLFSEAIRAEFTETLGRGYITVQDRAVISHIVVRAFHSHTFPSLKRTHGWL